MKKSAYFLSVAAVLAIAACNNSPAPRMGLAPGNYETTRASMDPYGNEIEQTTRSNVYYDQYGVQRQINETETTYDPDGLFNKQKTITQTYR